MSDREAVFGGERPPDPWAGRRQLDELTAEDLRATPAWWFPGPGRHLTGPDAATVMPLDADAAAEDGSVEFPDGQYLLHAVFTLADGSRLDGHVTFAPGDRGTIAEREPTLCAPRGQVALWFGALTPRPDEVAARLALLGRPRDAVFPLRWSATLHPPGADVAGEASGFAALREGRVAYV